MVWACPCGGEVIVASILAEFPVAVFINKVTIICRCLKCGAIINLKARQNNHIDVEVR